MTDTKQPRSSFWRKLSRRKFAQDQLKPGIRGQDGLFATPNALQEKKMGNRRRALAEFIESCNNQLQTCYNHSNNELQNCHSHYNNQLQNCSSHYSDFYNKYHQCEEKITKLNQEKQASNDRYARLQDDLRKCKEELENVTYERDTLNTKLKLMFNLRPPKSATTTGGKRKKSPRCRAVKKSRGKKR